MKLFILITTIIASTFAFAKEGDKGFIATPYLGYSSGTITSKTTPAFLSISGSQTFSEIPVGIILGYSFGGFWLGADVVYGASGTTVTSQPSGTANQTYTRLGLGADVGFRFGRNNIYLNYVASNALTIPAQNGFQASTGAGTAYGLNYLFEVNNHFAVGANYYIQSPTSTTTNSVTTQWSTIYSSYTSSNFGLIVQFPLVN